VITEDDKQSLFENTMSAKNYDSADTEDDSIEFDHMKSKYDVNGATRNEEKQIMVQALSKSI